MTQALQSSASFGLPNSSRQPKTPMSKLDVMWALMSLSLLAFVASYLFDGRSTILTHAFQIASSAGCGLAWLLSRALFREPEGDERWTYAVVGILFMIGLTLYVARVAGFERDGFLAVLTQSSVLISSTMMLMPVFEAIDGISKKEKDERRFRMAFLGVYGLILLAAITVSIPALAGVEQMIQVIICLFCLAAAAIAVQHRKRLMAEKKTARCDDADARHLASALTSLLEKERIFLEPEIKVSDLARRLGTAQYKVTRCITGPLAFKNFNQMINAYRIDEAKRLLSDETHDQRSILSIAMDSGFGSIGPFNRAFKQRTGMTPLEYRRAR